MKRKIQGMVVGVLLSATAMAAGLSDETAPAYRYVIVLESSARMERQREVALDTVHRLILSGINGRMQAGEVLGIWTFRDRLERDHFRPIIWAPGRALDVANDVYRTLRDQSFAREPNLDAAMEGVLEMARGVDRLTVFLVVSGTQLIQGARFDDEINDVYTQHAEAMRQSRRPFVTVLVLDRGQAVAHGTSPGGGPIYIPPAPAVVPVTVREPDPVEVISRPEAEAEAEAEANDLLAGIVAQLAEQQRPVAADAGVPPRAMEPEPAASPARRPMTVEEIEKRLREAQQELARKEMELAAVQGHEQAVDVEVADEGVQERIVPEPELLEGGQPEPVMEATAGPGKIPESSEVEEEAVELVAPGMVVGDAGGGRLAYLVAGLGLLLVAVVLSWWLLRGSQPRRSRPSAISRSMKRI